MNSVSLLICSLLYLCLLFLIAYWAERRSQTDYPNLTNNPYLYALSMAVFCTAWTFYGSVGRATSEGISFLAVYVGPTLTAPLWWMLLRKIIRICKAQRITSIADFISARYGKSRALGMLVTVLCVIGVIPYISIQLKAVSGSVAVLSGRAGAEMAVARDQAFYITLLLAVFTILFGTRKLEAHERHEGLVTAIAFESFVKLLSFLAVGVFVTFVLFSGPAEIFEQAARIPALREQFTMDTGHSSADWFWYCLLSGMAFLFLPRQFHVSVVENVDEKHLNKAMWLFPLYLFLINLFVFPVAFGGQILLPGNVNADTYVLTLPLQARQGGLVLLAYIGGFSAATSMIIMETTALSVMISNNLVMPLLVSYPRLQRQVGVGSSEFVINTRRIAILLLMLLAYYYYREVGDNYSLVSVGMISFAAVAQFGPAIIGGLYWKNGTHFGATAGLIAGTLVWFYTLILPTLVPVGLAPETIMTEGPFGIGLLRPHQLFGLSSLSPIPQAVFWSLFINTVVYIWGSLNRPQQSLDHNQAVLFVDVFRYGRAMESSAVWKGKALISDLRSILARFFDEEPAARMLDRYMSRHQLDARQRYAEPALVTYTEKLLAGAVGAASARILVSSVAKEETVSLDEVIRILKTSQELKAFNKELKRKSLELEQLTDQLSEANERLRRIDQQKNDFLSTVTHEIRTPITSIRALTEIMHDNPDIDEASRQHFLNTVIRESERLTRLINQVLDLERIESGRYQMNPEALRLDDVVQEAVESVAQLAVEKNVRLLVDHRCAEQIIADRDRLMQVVINLLSNAIKFSESGRGEIRVATYETDKEAVLSVTDNGIGIDPDLHELIFEKFYQANVREGVQQETGVDAGVRTVRKPKGSGLGLAISKKIIELHHGSLRVDSTPGQGSTFTVRLPKSE